MMANIRSRCASIQFQMVLLLFIFNIASSYIVYNEPEAKLFLNLAAAAYPTPGNATFREQCINTTFPNDNYTVYAAVSTPCDKKHNLCQAFAAVSNISRSIILSFRGTEGSSQLYQEMRDSLIDYEPYNETDKYGNISQVGRVNKYFYRAMNILWNEIAVNLTKEYPNYKYLVTGHSLGGALAALTAFRLSYRGILSDKYLVRLYTFGEPREGDYDYAQTFQDYVPYSFRIVHWTDPVPHLPPLHEDQLTGSGWPFHHTREIWYNSKFTSYTLCNSTFGEDPNCSDKKRFWTYGEKAMKEHLHYFNHFISQYGWNGCSSATMYTILVPIIISLVRIVVME